MSNTVKHRYVDVEERDDALYMYDSNDKKYKYLCRYLDVSQVTKDILTGNVSVEMGYSYKGDYMTTIVDRGIFTKGKLLNALPSKGIDVTENNVGKVLNYLLAREEDAPHINSHKKLGWSEIDGEEVFLHQEVVGGTIESTYMGDLNVEPKGSYKEWKNVVTTHVLSNKYLELALVLGFSSPIASKLRKLLGLDVLFFHIYGRSTTGKTTALIVATSAFGYPRKNNKGLIKTWSATDNAILGYLTELHGIPMAIDEASMRSNKDYTSMIYQLTDGLDKARAQKDGSVRERKEFSGTLLSTAENSMLSGSSHNNGLRVRLVELGQMQWTESADQATSIKEGLLANYGQAGQKFVKVFQKLTDEQIIQLFNESKRYVNELIPKRDELTERISEKIAVIHMTARLVSKIFNLELEIDTIVDILIQADAKQLEERNLGEKAYECIKEAVLKNLNKFIHKPQLESFSVQSKQYQEDEMPKGEIIGKIEMVNKKMKQILIFKHELEKILHEHHFSDVNTILDTWREKSVIEADTDGKFTRKRVLHKGTTSQRVVVINVDKEYDQYKTKVE